jgi:hypothetical protein
MENCPTEYSEIKNTVMFFTFTVLGLLVGEKIHRNKVTHVGNPCSVTLLLPPLGHNTYIFA